MTTYIMAPAAKLKRYGRAGRIRVAARIVRKAPDGFHDAGQNAVEEGFSLACALGPERQGDDRALGKVLDGNTDGQGQRTCYGDISIAGEPSRVDNAHRHTLWNVVECHGQHQHRRALQVASGALCLVAVPV